MSEMSRSDATDDSTDDPDDDKRYKEVTVKHKGKNMPIGRMHKSAVSRIDFLTSGPHRSFSELDSENQTGKWFGYDISWTDTELSIVVNTSTYTLEINGGLYSPEFSAMTNKESVRQQAYLVLSKKKLETILLFLNKFKTGPDGKPIAQSIRVGLQLAIDIKNRSPVKKSLRATTVGKGADTKTSPDALIGKLSTIQATMRNGNRGKMVRKMLYDTLDQLYSKGIISKSDYLQLSEHTK
jgi:hypothetical protein